MNFLGTCVKVIPFQRREEEWTSTIIINPEKGK
jgi:hypothetical protein